MAQKISAPVMDRRLPENLDPQLAHPDDLLGLVIAERNPQVAREPQVVRLPVTHPGGQGVPLALELSLPGGVKDDPGGCGVAEVPRVQAECGRAVGLWRGFPQPAPQRGAVLARTRDLIEIRSAPRLRARRNHPDHRKPSLTSPRRREARRVHACNARRFRSTTQRRDRDRQAWRPGDVVFRGGQEGHFAVRRFRG
jgi:hypothetical protein